MPFAASCCQTHRPGRLRDPRRSRHRITPSCPSACDRFGHSACESPPVQQVPQYPGCASAAVGPLSVDGLLWFCLHSFTQATRSKAHRRRASGLLVASTSRLKALGSLRHPVQRVRMSVHRAPPPAPALVLLGLQPRWSMGTLSLSGFLLPTVNCQESTASPTAAPAGRFTSFPR